MRLIIGAFLLATSLASADIAAACPIDLAPCEESLPPALDEHSGLIVLLSSGSTADTPSTEDAPFKMSPPAQELVVYRNDEDDLVSPEHPRVDLEGVSLPAFADALAAVPTRRFLLDDEDLIDVEHTGRVETASATSDVAQSDWALDGYEDR